MRLYFNPRCSKSRAARDLLADAGRDVEIVDYQRRPPDSATLAALVDALDAPPASLVRGNDPAFDPDAAGPLDRRHVIELLAARPGLMQRPVLVAGDRAVIARPPERVFELIDPPTQDDPRP
ncbi:arsenate reductase [Salinisphaera orenii MK-B5]|uniref:Arsenate reductase n=1 Tax=Salinisphaera orenii MK-B5 TaxID=856730 RepID=A0A423PQ35_9GAMM|nr:ArsC/Spx/MgsR family protein [Salinisphaera orenii]ROO27719.1 arsenate reductase [Salinisphaera orenii MK-B5]